MLLSLVIIAGTGPGEALWAWIAMPVLAVVWATGLWWRWDSPDRRDPVLERERRGF
jgi:hypothetical protein